MKTTEISLDQNILAPFQNIFRQMDISKKGVELAALDLDLPPLDFSVRSKLEFDGLEADENFLIRPPEFLKPQLYLKYKNRPVLVYQRDQFLTQEEYDKGRLRAYHLCFCKALRDAHAQNRYEGCYVMTYNISGKFKVNLSVRDKNFSGAVYTVQKEQNVRRPLKVCQHCLREINWQHFRSYCGGGLEWWRGGDKFMRELIVEDFNLEEYFLTARRSDFFDHPVMGTAASAVRKEYVLSPEDKFALKELAGFICESCHETFEPRELEIHHRNHLPGDNRRDNLMVVCHECHAQIHEVEQGFVTRREKAAKSDEVEISRAEYAAAQKKLGDMYAKIDADKTKGFYKKALDSYKILAAGGNVDALYEIGDYAGALGKYQLLANTGDVRAKIRLGLMYAKGLGVAKNLNEAKKFLADAKKSAKIIDSELIELCRLAGTKDEALKLHAKAVQLFEVTANLGDEIVAFELAKLYSDENFISEINADLVKKFRDQAAELCDAQIADYEGAHSVAAIVKRAKEGNVKAILRLKKAAQEGDVEAKAALKNLYYDGKKEHAVGTVILRDGLNSVREGMFEYCRELNRIILPESLGVIGWHAFASCNNLWKIDLPAALTKIGGFAFRDCTSLSEIVLPENVNSIGERAFWHCTNLKKITLPENLTVVEDEVFLGCNNLTSVTYPRKIEQLAKECFGERWDILEKTVLD